MGQRGRHRIIVREWTDLQKYCYGRNCNCYGCPIIETVESLRGTKCQMKRMIREYILEYGVPDYVEKKGIIDEEDI